MSPNFWDIESSGSRLGGMLGATAFIGLGADGGRMKGERFLLQVVSLKRHSCFLIDRSDYAKAVTGQRPVLQLIFWNEDGFCANLLTAVS